MKRWEHLWTSKSDEWSTPRDLFEDLDAKFKFGLDAAASERNAKHSMFLTAEVDAIEQDWGYWSDGFSVWLNPPYSGVDEFVDKAIEESKTVVVVVLLYMRSDTQWFQRIAYGGRCSEIWTVEGRVRFEREGEDATSAPAPSALFILTPWASGVPKLVPYKQPRLR